MRNVVIWSVVLVAMAANALGEEPKLVGQGKAVAGGKTKSPPKELTVDLGKGIKLEMVLISAGEFKMGSPDSEEGAYDWEEPQHRVRITKPFYLGKYLVTQEQWEAVMGNNPSGFKGTKNPVETVSWDDCQQFVGKLNAKVGTQGGKFVLPTETQWEYACRAESKTRFCFGDDESKLGEYAWYRANSDEKTHPVGQKKPNAWGLYDMHGNVWEWCQDWWKNEYYKESAVDDPTGPIRGRFRVIRGGGWTDRARMCQSAYRSTGLPGDRYSLPGLACLPSSGGRVKQADPCLPLPENDMTQSNDPTEILSRLSGPSKSGSICRTATALLLTGALFVGVVGTQARFNRIFLEFGTKLMSLTDFVRSPSFAWLAGTLFVVTIAVEFGLKRRKWKAPSKTIAILVAMLMAAAYVVGMFSPLVSMAIYRASERQHRLAAAEEAAGTFFPLRGKKVLFRLAPTKTKKKPELIGTRDCQKPWRGSIIRRAARTCWPGESRWGHRR